MTRRFGILKTVAGAFASFLLIPTPQTAQTWSQKESTSSTSIRPFHVHFPDETLADLKRRIAATRWPDKETVADQSQGVQLATMQKLAQLLGDRVRLAQVRGETERPAAVPHRDRRGRHPLHPRAVEASERAADDRHARMAGLDHRADEDHRAADKSDGAWRDRGGRVRRRDSVAAGLRVLRASRRRLAGIPSASRVRGSMLMKRLGYTRFVAQGGDWGNAVTEQMALRQPPELLGIHTNMPATVPAEIGKAAFAGAAAARRPLGRRKARVGTARLTSTSTAWATPARWRTARRRCTGSGIRRRPGRVDARPRCEQPGAHRPRL